MAFKKFRKLKVYGMRDHNWRDTPTIILKGKWLKEAGFDVDTPIMVECVDGKLVVTQREEEEEQFVTPCGVCSCVAEKCVAYGKKGRK